MKQIKKIISLCIILIMIISYVIPVMAYSDKNFTVKRSATRDGYQYWIDGKRVNKFSVSDYDAAYCLKAEANFEATSYTYNRTYNMKADISEIKAVDWGSNKLSHSKNTVSIKRSYEKDSGTKNYTKPVLTVNENGSGTTYCNYNAVLWILDNMYVPVSDETQNKTFKKQLYEEVFADAIKNSGFKVSSVKLTDEDIQVVQQWAIWYFTNSSDSKYHVTKLPTVKVNNKTINSLNQTGRNQKYMNALYVYLIENAMKNSDEYGYGDTRKVKTPYTDRIYLCSIAGKYGSQQPIAKVTRDIPTDGKYNVVVRKYDSSTGKLINTDMKVKITDPSSKTSTKTVKGQTTVGTFKITDIMENDTIKIEEASAPNGYSKLNGGITLDITKKIANGKYTVSGATVKYDSSKDKKYINVKVNPDNAVLDINSGEETNTIYVDIYDKPVEADFELSVNKVDASTGNKINAKAVFKMELPSELKSEDNSSKVSTDKGIADFGTISVSDTKNIAGTFKIYLTEVQEPVGYIGLGTDKKIELSVTTKADSTGTKCIVNSVSVNIVDTDNNILEKNPENIKAQISDENKIELIVPNEQVSGKYQLKLTKVDEDNTNMELDGAEFSARVSDSISDDTYNVSGGELLADKSIDSEGRDIYVITEITAPDGYKKLDNPIEIYVDRKLNGDKYSIDVTTNSPDKVIIERDLDEAIGVNIKIKNKKLEGNYEIYLLKEDSLTGEKINTSDVVFEVSRNGGTAQEINLGTTSKIGPFSIESVEQVDTYVITEVSAPSGYIKLDKPISVAVTTSELDGKYVLDSVKTDSDYAEAYISDDGAIYVTIDNDKINGAYQLDILKIDADTKEQISGAKFEIKYPGNSEYTELTFEEGDFLTSPIDINEEGVDTIYLREKEAPESYDKLIDELKIEVTKKLEDDKFVVKECTITNADGSSAPEGTEINLKDDSTIELKVPNKINEEKEEITEYDMSLRKFITSVNDKAPEVSREPKVDTSKLVDGSSTTATYTHTKEPLLVANTDIVVYTIRMYNEGISSAYVAEVKDDIPVGLEFIVDNEINEKYGWKMYDNSGVETTDVKEVKTIRTDYLSKENSELRDEDNLLQAFDYKEDSELDYRDVQVAFKVSSDSVAEDRIIINTAEITKETDENGKIVEDRDSTPDNDKEGEDDIDKEYLKLKYFDLSLLKWVSSTIITDNGAITETLTGHTGLENPEPVVKVDINRKRVDQVVVKFAYTIKVTNEGELEGYAKEISDYVPDGLRFVAEDNPEWSQVDGKIVTRQLENTLLNPGESAEVKVILTWNNSENNLGLKTNVAEISEDYNKYNEHDIDSTPNNLVEGEDDIDNASVLLSIATGKAKTYTVLIVVIMVTLASGIVLIKKFVLR